MRQNWLPLLLHFCQTPDFPFLQAGDLLYNRYVPRSDGTHQRSRVVEPSVPRSTPTHNPIAVPVSTPQPCNPPGSTPQPCNTPVSTPQHCNTPTNSITGFFKNLLPKNIDTGDLIVVLLLLLMANDCEQDRNHALLTLALYFFL